MKKIINFIVIFIICLVPQAVFAKTIVKYEWKVEDNYIYSNDNGTYYLFNRNDFNMNAYSKEGNLVNTIEFMDLFYGRSFDEISKTKHLASYMSFQGYTPVTYNAKYDEYYSVDFDNERISIYDKERDIDFSVTHKFEDDIDFIKDMIGFYYDIYEDAKNDGLVIYNLFVDGDYYVTYCSEGIIRIYNKKAEVLFETEEDPEAFSYKFVHINNGYIYVLYNQYMLDIYNIDGKFLETVDFSSYLIDALKDYENCDFDLFYFEIFDNNLVLSYDMFFEEDMAEVSNKFDLAKIALNTNSISLKFKLSYEVDHVESDKGNVTYTSKVDEYDREYVELNIVPKEGYVVESVVVSDAFGTVLEVVDNKFFMPGSDVKIDVQYRVAEYVPIPDTYFSIKTLLLCFGVFILSFGLYLVFVTVCDKRVNQE